MSDPFSIIAGVISIATVAAQSSQALSNLIDNIREAPREIRAVARDVHAYRSIVSSLKIAVEERDVKSAVSGDAALVEMIGNLSYPLNTFEEALQSLVSRMLIGFGRSESNAFRKSTLNVKWGFFARKEVKELQSRLEAAKSTLNAALETITMLSSVRTMAATQSAQWCSPSADVNFTIGFLTQDFIDHDSRREGSSNQALDPSDRSPSLQQRLQELQGPLVGDTRGNATSESLPLIRYLAEISLELSSHSLQIQQLRSALERSGNTPDGESAQSEVATPIDVFLDCVSSLPDVECKTPLERIEQDFSGSPNPYLESSPFFYPEQYTLEDLFNDRLSVHAMIQSEEDERIQKLFITYAQARQGWRRVVVSAAFQKKSTYPEFQCSVHGDQELWPQTLPKAVFKILNDLLSGLDLYASITHLSLPLSEDQTGGLVVDLDGVRTFQDDREVALCHEGQILQDIEDMNCTVFLESEIVVRSRNSVSRFMVCVDSQTCMERKAPFASAAARGGNSFQEFCDDLKRLLQLRCCRNVIQFIGVVLDDTRKHLRCYLYEYPNYNIQQIFESASSLSSTVSWNVRETWAQQIITAIAEVHETGMVVGLGELATINIRADGSAVLAGGTTSTWRTVTKLHGYQAPELRRSGKDAVPDIPTHSTLTSIVSTSDASTSIALSSKAANNAITTTTSAQAVSSTPPAADGVGKSESTTPTNFRTDMFTLGMILWQLAEHRAGLPTPTRLNCQAAV